MYSVTNPFYSTLFAAWMVIVVATDNFLTPILMGRNSQVPMLVLLLGSMGGFITMGFLGLFVGAVILSIGYKLFDNWLNSKVIIQYLGHIGDRCHQKKVSPNLPLPEKPAQTH